MIKLSAIKRSAGRIGLVIAATLAVSAYVVPAMAQEAEQFLPTRQSWSFAGPFGSFDKEQLQRGFKVYKEVCSNCHSLNRIAFRNLSDSGGPGFTDGQVKGLAATYKVQDGPNDQGDMFDRQGRPADYFPLVFANDNAARFANGGAIPPDMSLLAKARSYKAGFPQFIFDFFTQYEESGPDYIHALIADGYVDPPAGTKLPTGTHYNKIFPAHAIAMPKPLTDGQVDYSDGAPQTVDQYTKDVAAFLMWAAEPNLVERHQMGFKVIIFLIVLSFLLYFTKKKVWKKVDETWEGGDITSVGHG